jgi:hypothetical protein
MEDKILARGERRESAGTVYTYRELRTSSTPSNKALCRLPVKDPATLERHIAALRKAGLK